jgi:hypothetical protein
MDPQMNHIEQQALGLPPHERKMLAARLLKSLDNKILNDIDRDRSLSAEKKGLDELVGTLTPEEAKEMQRCIDREFSKIEGEW